MPSISASFSFDFSFLSRAMARFSTSNWVIFRMVSSISSGILSASMRSLAAASSMRSMALSGRKRSAM